MNTSRTRRAVALSAGTAGLLAAAVAAPASADTLGTATFTVGDRGTFLRVSDDGTAQVARDVTKSALRSVDAEASLAIAVGDRGTILRSDNSGQTFGVVEVTDSRARR
jgi:photosystem II stability/assembly factor-like uncharacterized protein